MFPGKGESELLILAHPDKRKARWILTVLWEI